MDLHQFNKEHYFLEVSRRHQLATALTIPVGVLTVLGGALLILARDLQAPLGSLELVQLLLIIPSAVAMAVTVYFLVRSYFNYSYGYIATPKELQDFYKSLIEYHQNADGNLQDANAELEEYVNTEYASYAHINTGNNDRKSSNLHKANGFLIASLVCTVLAGFPYVAKSIIAGDDVKKIEVINCNSPQLGATSMLEKPMPEPTKQQQPTPPQTLVKPSPPPGRIIKESEDPKKVR